MPCTKHSGSQLHTITRLNSLSVGLKGCVSNKILTLFWKGIVIWILMVSSLKRVLQLGLIIPFIGS